MKEHLRSLFDYKHRCRTLVFFLAGVTLIIGSLLAETLESLPGKALLAGGMVFLFLALLHPWKKMKRYAFVAWISLGLLLLTLLSVDILSGTDKAEFLREAVIMGFIFVICVPGVIAGVIGIHWLSKRGA